MKVKIRETSERINYVNTEDSEQNYLRILITQIIKYITLYTKE